MKRLIIGQIPQDFNFSNDIPIGPWCFLSREEVYPDWYKIRFDEVFKSHEDFCVAADKTYLITEKIIPVLVQKLNNILNLEESDYFWKIILYPTILTFITAFVYRKQLVNNFIEKYRDEIILLELIDFENEIVFQNNSDFIYNGIRNVNYNDWIISRIFELERIPPNWIVQKKFKSFYKPHTPGVFMQDEIDDPLKYKNPESYPKQKKMKVRKFFEKKIDWLFGNKKYYLKRCHSCFGLSDFQSTIFSLLLKILPSKENFRLNNVFHYNPIHIKNNEVFFNEKWIEIIWSHLPKDLLQIKDKIIDIKQDIKTKLGKIRLLGPNFSLESLISTALASEAKEIIILTQHGYLANQKDLPAFFLMELTFDIYFSWGVKKYQNYSAKIIKSSAFRCLEFLNKHRFNNKKNILVGTASYPLSSDLLDNTLGRINFCGLSRQRKIKFLNEINEKILSNIWYRNYTNYNQQFIDAGFLVKKYEKLNLMRDCDGYDFHRELLNCKIMVLDHPGTTLCLTLVANTPFIIFFDEKMWPINSENYSFFQNLKKVDVFFNDPKDAAEQINKIYEYVEIWWNEPERRKVIKDFRNNFAHISKHWMLDTMKTLWEI